MHDRLIVGRALEGAVAMKGVEAGLVGAGRATSDLGEEHGASRVLSSLNCPAWIVDVQIGEMTVQRSLGIWWQSWTGI